MVGGEGGLVLGAANESQCSRHTIRPRWIIHPRHAVGRNVKSLKMLPMVPHSYEASKKPAALVGVQAQLAGSFPYWCKRDIMRKAKHLFNTYSLYTHPL